MTTTDGDLKRTFTCASCSYSYTLRSKEPWPTNCSQCKDPTGFLPTTTAAQQIELKVVEEKENEVVYNMVETNPVSFEEIHGGGDPVNWDAKSTFVKHDDDKLRWDLLPNSALKGVIRALMHGTKEYDDHNWKKGAEWSRYYNSAMRHLTDWWEGEDNDPDSDLNPLYHAMCCLVFLSYYSERGEKYGSFDDRK